MGIQVGDGQKHGGMDEINVTPLIDVVLVLLIIFMVLTPITVEKMAGNLPPVDDTEEPPPPDQQPDQLMVAVYEDGSTALNLKPFGAAEDAALRDELSKRIRSRAKKNVFVDAHPEANYARVVTIMDLVRETGAEKVGFADLKEEGPARLTAGAVLPTDSTAVGAAGAAPATPVP